MRKEPIIILALLCLVYCRALSQQSTDSLAHVPSHYLSVVCAKSERLAKKMITRSSKTLRHFQKQESIINRKLAVKDSTKAAAVFGETQQSYASLEHRLQNTPVKSYISTIDTLSTSLQFLKQRPQLLSATRDAQQKLSEATAKVKELEAQFQQAQEIKQFLKERRAYLRSQLSNLGYGKQLKQLNKQSYYYSQHINQYKELLKDHQKAEKKAITQLSKTKLFRDFIRKNSQLASLFRMPGDPTDPASQANLAGLQTRAQVNGYIQQQLNAEGTNAQVQLQQHLQSAQSQISELKNKVLQSGQGSSDAEMPEGFKPNNQRTKSFLQRLELGTNIQSQRASVYFPTSSDIGISLGYKLNDKSIIGIGVSYKIGWGSDIKHIHITHLGIGLRSFVDFKIKGSYWLTGAYERNYRSEFSNIDVLKDLNAWQQSGLIGISKVVYLSARFLKQTKLQLLWDVCSYQQMPRTQPFLFRCGYILK